MPESLAIVRLGPVVVSVQHGGDREPVLDPDERRRVLHELARSLEAFPGRLRVALCERRPPGAEQRLRPRCGRVLRQVRSPEKMLARGVEVVGLKGNVAQSEEGLRGLVEALDERQVEPARNGRLPGRQRSGGDRQIAPQQLPASGHVLVLRQAGAGGKSEQHGDGCERA